MIYVFLLAVGSAIFGLALALPAPQVEAERPPATGHSATTQGLYVRPTGISLRSPHDIFALLDGAPHDNLFRTTVFNQHPSVTYRTPSSVSRGSTSPPGPSSTSQATLSSIRAFSPLPPLPSLRPTSATTRPAPVSTPHHTHTSTAKPSSLGISRTGAATQSANAYPYVRPVDKTQDGISFRDPPRHDNSSRRTSSHDTTGAASRTKGRTRAHKSTAISSSSGASTTRSTVQSGSVYPFAIPVDKIQDDLSFPERLPHENSSGHLSPFAMIGIIFAILSALTLLTFLIVETIRKCCCVRKGGGSSDNKTKPPGSFFWSTFSVPATTHKKPRKPVNYGVNPFEDPEKGAATQTITSPRSKFSVTSSDYSHRSKDSTGTTDTVLVQNTRANTSIPPPPVRPPRPPSLDTSSMVFVDRPPFIPVTGPADTRFSDPFLSLGSEPSADIASPMTQFESPLLPPTTFLIMDHPPAYTTSASHTSLPEMPVPHPVNIQASQARRVRTKSAPILGEESSDDARNILPRLGLVARKVLQHRRSRSASGWAYRKRNARSCNGTQLGSDQGGVGVALE